MDNDMKIEQYLEEKIDNEKIEKVSYQLAKQEWQDQADLLSESKKNMRQKQSELYGIVDDRYLYLGKDNLLQVDPVYNSELSLGSSQEFKYEYGMKQFELPDRLRDYSTEQQQIYQIYQRISAKYFNEKAKVISEIVKSKTPVVFDGRENELVV